MPDPGEGETVQPLGPWPGDPLGPTSDLAHRPEWANAPPRRPAPPRPPGQCPRSADALTRPCGGSFGGRTAGPESPEQPPRPLRRPAVGLPPAIRPPRSPRGRRLGARRPAPPPGPGCPDAGATLPVAARRPRRGHAPPEQKEKARYEGQPGGVSRRAQQGRRGWPLGHLPGALGYWLLQVGASPTLQMGRLRPMAPASPAGPRRLWEERKGRAGLSAPTP